MSGYISSDNENENESPGSQASAPPTFNAKPTLNEGLMEQNGYRPRFNPRIPGYYGRYGYNPYNPISSKQWGNAPFFPNARPASMLERGWVRCENFNLLIPGQKGLLKLDDGPEMLIIVTDVPMGGKLRITVKQLGTGGNKSEPFDLFQNQQFSTWDIYLPTEAVPFIRRQEAQGEGGYKKTRGKKSRVKTSKRGTKAKSKNTRRKA